MKNDSKTKRLLDVIKYTDEIDVALSNQDENYNYMASLYTVMKGRIVYRTPEYKTLRLEDFKGETSIVLGVPDLNDMENDKGLEISYNKKHKEFNYNVSKNGEIKDVGIRKLSDMKNLNDLARFFTDAVLSYKKFK